MPPRKEIAKLMKQLPSRIEALLKKCAQPTPSYVPDYLAFSSDAIKLLEPFIAYSDAMFHAGSYTDVYGSALRIFAAKKMENERLFRESKQQLHRSETDETMKALMRFKLLLSFFGYTEQQYPGNMRQLADLEYRLEHEKDPHVCRELLEEISKIMGESSTGLYAKTLLALNEGDLDGALALCERAIEKFKGNTPVYKLKANILQAISRRTIKEGLQNEPRDQTLRLALDIEDQLWKLRDRCANGLLDPEVAIERLERLVQEEIRQRGIELEPYEEEVKKSLQSTRALQPKTMKFLCTGEFLLTELPRQLDYAPSAIEFCKAIENELHEHLFEPFKSWCLKNLPRVKSISDEVLFGFIYKDKKLTLGTMAIMFQFLPSKKKLKKVKLLQELRDFVDSLPRPEFLLGTCGMRPAFTPEKVNMYRNSAAHLSEFTLRKAQETKKWCYQLLNSLHACIVR